MQTLNLYSPRNHLSLLESRNRNGDIMPVHPSVTSQCFCSQVTCVVRYLSSKWQIETFVDHVSVTGQAGQREPVTMLTTEYGVGGSGI
jgi:hypothetical protein